MSIEYFDIDGTVIQYALLAWGIVAIIRAICKALSNTEGKKK